MLSVKYKKTINKSVNQGRITPSLNLSIFVFYIAKRIISCITSRCAAIVWGAIKEKNNVNSLNACFIRAEKALYWKVWYNGLGVILPWSSEMMQYNNSDACYNTCRMLKIAFYSTI